MRPLKNLVDIQGLKVEDLANQFGTPLYLFDSMSILKSYERLKQFLGEKVGICYSFKANPNVSIGAYLRKLGANAEVCSLAELENALMAGYRPKDIIFVGPFKAKNAIAQSVRLGILIVCESFEELCMIQSIAKESKTVAQILVRINPDFISNDALLKMGGKPSQFGIDEQVVTNQFDQFLKLSNVLVKGIHVYSGTRILDANTICSSTESILHIADKIQTQWHTRFEYVDIGGGFGVPYFENEEDIDLLSSQSRFIEIINTYLTKYPKSNILAESGRFLVAKSGYFISRVFSIKKSKGECFLVTDGGTNCHMSAVGIGSILKRNFPMVKVGKTKGKKEPYHITGPLCTPNDIVGKKVLLSDVRVNDLIAVLFSGAYGLTASPGYFLSHGFPAEVFIHDNAAKLIRERDDIFDINGKQILIF